MNKKNGITQATGKTGELVVPRHIAIIMDGNGRWARSRFLPRVEGHRAGAKTVRVVVEECRRLGVKYLTLFAFSTENWKRPEDEVSALMKLFRQYLESELEALTKNGIRLRAIGDLSRLPTFVRETLEKSIESSANQTGMQLVLAISYGGREEIVNAARTLCKKAISREIDPEKISEADFSGCLYAPDIPDPELLIRTSDENRISNFLLWQLSYAEIVVTPVLWPEFSKEELYRCIGEFSCRDRRFGLTEEQINNGIRTDLERG